jgi:hypothetical protein
MTIRAWTSRAVRLLAVLACAMAVASPAAPAAAAAGHGWLRLAHLSPNTPAVDVYLYPFGNHRPIIVLKHVAYGTVSPYERVASGDYTVAMRGAGAAPHSRPVLSTTVNVAAGSAYTVAGMGPYKGLRLQIMHDQLTAPQGKALVRVIQASLKQHQLTVSIGSHQVASDLNFAKMTAYESVAPGSWMLRADGSSEQSAHRVALAPGSIHTVVVLDDSGHLGIRVLEDAAGSTQIPAGAAATGLGGTAARPGPALVPWLAIAASGLLVALLGLGRARRSRVAGSLAGAAALAQADLAGVQESPSGLGGSRHLAGRLH